MLVVKNVPVFFHENEVIEFIKGIPQYLSQYKISASRTLYAKTAFGYILLQQILKEPFSIWIEHYIIKQPATKLLAIKNTQVTCIYAGLKGNYQMIQNGLPEVSIEAGKVNFFSTPALNCKLSFEKPGIYSVWVLHIPPETLNKNGQVSPQLFKIINKIKRGNPVINSNVNMGIQLRELICEITNKPFINKRELNIEKSILETLQQLNGHNSIPIFSDYELSIVNKLETGLMESINQPELPSFQSLNMPTRISKKRIYKIFKIIYGNTPAAYFRNARWNEIYLTIVTTQTPLKDISDKYGYENYPAFSIAFKRRYGTSPILMRTTAI